MAQRRSRKSGRSRKESVNKPHLRARRAPDERKQRAQKGERRTPARQPRIDVRAPGWRGALAAWGIGWLVIAGFAALMYLLDRWWVISFPDSIWWMACLGSLAAAPAVGTVSRDRLDVRNWSFHIAVVALLALAIELALAPRCPAGVECGPYGAFGEFGIVGSFAALVTTIAWAWALADVSYFFAMRGRSPQTPVEYGRRGGPVSPFTAIAVACALSGIALLVAVVDRAIQFELDPEGSADRSLLILGPLLLIVGAVWWRTLRERRGLLPAQPEGELRGRTRLRWVTAAMLPFILLAGAPAGAAALMVDTMVRDEPTRALLALDTVREECFGFEERLPALALRPDPSPRASFASNYLVRLDVEKRKGANGKAISRVLYRDEPTPYEAMISVVRAPDGDLITPFSTCRRLHPTNGGAATPEDLQTPDFGRETPAPACTMLSAGQVSFKTCPVVQGPDEEATIGGAGAATPTPVPGG